MEGDLFTPLLAMGLRCMLVIGVMLFIISLRRDTWIIVFGHD